MYFRVELNFSNSFSSFYNILYRVNTAHLLSRVGKGAKSSAVTGCWNCNEGLCTDHTSSRSPRFHSNTCQINNECLVGVVSGHVTVT